MLQHSLRQFLVRTGEVHEDCRVKHALRRFTWKLKTTFYVLFSSYSFVCERCFRNNVSCKQHAYLATYAVILLYAKYSKDLLILRDTWMLFGKKNYKMNANNSCQTCHYYYIIFKLIICNMQQNTLNLRPELAVNYTYYIYQTYIHLRSHLQPSSRYTVIEHFRRSICLAYILQSMICCLFVVLFAICFSCSSLQLKVSV